MENLPAITIEPVLPPPVAEPLPVALEATSSRWSRVGRVLSGPLIAGVLLSGPGGDPSMGLTLETEATTAPVAGAAVLAGAEQPATETCPPPPDTAEGWTRMMDEVEGWSIGDGVTSLGMPDGRVLVSTGDNVVLDPDGNRFLNNALISVCGDEARSLSPDRAIIPGSAEQWFWPGEMIVDSGKLYVFASRQAPVGNGGGNDLGGFRGVGVDLAVFNLPGSADEAPVLQYMAPTPGSNLPEFDADGVRRNIQWNGSIARGPDGFLYIMGSRLDPEWANLGRDAFVARVPADSGALESPEAWRYWNGSDWSESMADAHSVIDSAEQPGLDVTWTASYENENGRFKIVSKRDGMFGQEVGEWTADTPAGPYDYRAILQLPPFDNEKITYNAHHHPAVPLRDGEVLISYNRRTAGADWSYVIANRQEFMSGWQSVPR